MRTAHVLVVASLAAVLVGAAAARAHQVGLSRGVWVDAEREVQAELVFARGEVAALCPGRDAGPAPGTLGRELDEIGACLLDGVVVERGGAPCPGAILGASLTEEDGFALRAVFTCAATGRTTADLSRLLARASTGHRHLGRVTTSEGEHDVVAFASHAAFSFGDARPTPQVAAYLRIGLEHILFGFDHLVFLLGLVLVGGRLRALVAIVTAFTLAHSLSLALAVLDVVAPSHRLIEPAIALSIAYVGVENFFIKSADKRWRITAPFGLVHGFGFAGALAQVGVPKDAVASALFLFNVGVELGQLAVLALVVPVLLVLERRVPRASARLKHALSIAVVMAGVFWFVERVFLSAGS